MTNQPSAEAVREFVMPGDPPNICDIALHWYLGFNFGYPHTVRESNIAVEGFKDGYRAALAAIREQGCAVVPVVPTDAMIAAGIIERHDAAVPEAWSLATANIYAAMIAAAHP